MPKPPYKILESKTIYQGHIIRLVKDRFVLDIAKDKVVTRELVLHPGAVVILPFYNKDHILLLKQFRYAAKGNLLEIPAGTLEKNEQVLTCAKRELEEETGFKARRWTKLTEFLPAPGISNERMFLFKAENLVKGKKNLDHDEWIEHEVVSLKKARRMIKRGEIEDAKTILAVLWASFLLTLFFLIAPIVCETASAADARAEGRVHWVIDGDTFELETGERVRLIGIDTPEFMPHRGRADFYGQAASKFSKALLTGQKVFLEQDVEAKDKYGRTLAYAYLENGDFVNLLLAKEGYAKVKYYRPNGKYYEILKEAEKEAKLLRKGLWAAKERNTRGLNLSHRL